MIRILIADDHAIVRRGLKQIVSENTGMVVAGEAADGKGAIEKVWDGKYDVVLLDVSMPGRSGLETLKQIKQQKPWLPVLMLSVHPEEQLALRALREGASGYLAKESAPSELVRAIKKVAVGGKYVSATLAEKLAMVRRGDVKRQPHEHLSSREYQVLCMIANGKTIKDIAQDLSLSVKTVSTYKTRILEKMGMHNNAEIIHYSVQKRLVSCVRPQNDAPGVRLLV